MPSEGTPRFSVRLTPDDLERIGRIREATGLQGAAAVIRWALVQADPARREGHQKNPKKSGKVS
jgi:hypothetical protein